MMMMLMMMLLRLEALEPWKMDIVIIHSNLPSSIRNFLGLHTAKRENKSQADERKPRRHYKRAGRVGRLRHVAIVACERALLCSWCYTATCAGKRTYFIDF